METIRIHMLDLKSYYPSPAYQLGLLVAYAMVEEEVRKNVEFTFTEHLREQPAEEIAKLILAGSTELVAISNYAWNYQKICKILDLLTNSHAKLPRIVLGGPNSAGTFGAAMMKRYPVISTTVEGEGEPAFRDICLSLVDSPSKDPFINSRNCVLRTEAGGILRPKMNHRIQYLDEVPSPYLTSILPTAPSPVFYETNRGCPYRCSFCYWGNGNSKVYRMSHERIREELEFFARKKVLAFWLADANFGIFPDDAEIAEMMCEINARYRYPFKHVGVNWAKNSSDRVLEIASIFRRGGMGCTTTLALQSVTSEAEERSRRYAMAPSKFVNLTSAAEGKNIDTYTDIIWGLPGENVEEYLNGLDAVLSTGVPSILIHQLYLLPGTEFYDDREKFGLRMLREIGGETVDPRERSDYWDYIVVSHPKMSREDMIRGTRLMGINHLLLNHDLGRVVNFYLARYGIAHREVYDFFDNVLLGRVEDFPEQGEEFLGELRRLILTFANSVGLDEFIFYRRLSELVWFKKDGRGNPDFNEPEVRALMHNFYEAFCRKHDLCRNSAEMDLLGDFVDYNVLISPKPAWKPKPSYTFKYDVHAIWRDMLEQILIIEDSDRVKPQNAKGSPPKIAAQKPAETTWGDLSRNVRARLAELLTNEYLEKRRGPVTYTVKNPWQIPPSRKNSDWLLSSRSKHCVVSAGV